MEKKLKLRSLRADIDKRRGGDWQDYQGELPVKVRMKVRGLDFPEFTTAREEALRALRSRHGAAVIPPDELTKVMGELYAEHILLDWEGFDEPYSPVVAREILSDPGYADTVTSIMIWCATKVGAARAETIEVAKGN